MNKNIRVSAIRMICTLMVVTLHVFQQMEKHVANLNIVTDTMNLGLVMFFCISAFLYSSRNITGVVKWYKHRYFEIVFPALIVGIVTVLIFTFAGDITTHKTFAAIMSSLGFEAFLDDSWMFIQLWFLTYLLFFYLTLPLAQRINCKCKSDMKFWSLLVLISFGALCISVLLERILKTELLNVGTLMRFYLPYFVFRRYGIENCRLKKIMIFFTGLCVPIIVVMSYIRYVAQIPGLSELVFIYSQTFIGFVLFYWLYNIFSCLKNYNKVLQISDKYSYNIYLTHCLFIGYKTSMIYMAPNIFVGIIIALFMTVISSILLDLVVKKFKKQL